jgi:hypothetical protein
LRLVTARARDAGNRLACLGIKNAFRAICDEAAGGASTRDAFVGALGRANFWLVPEQAQCGGTLVWIRDAACYTRSVAAMSRRQAGEGLRGVGGFCYAGERLLRIGKRRVCRGKVCFQLVIPAGHAGRESGTVTADVLSSTRRLVRVHARRDVSGARKVRVGRGGAACPLVRGVLAADALCERSGTAG